MVGLPGRVRMVGKALSASFNREEVPWWRIIRADELIVRTSNVVNTIKQNG